MKKVQENNSLMNGFEELDDDMLDGVAGGLVQLVNPSSSRLGLDEGDTTQFHDGRTCPNCGCNKVIITKKWKEDRTYYNVKCKDCGNPMGEYLTSDDIQP